MSTLSTTQRYLLALLVLVLIGIVAFFCYNFWHSQQGTSTANSFTKPQLFLGNALTGPLYSLDISTPNQKPQVSVVSGIPGGGLVDVARGAGKTFYAIESPDKKATNIYFTSTSDTKQVFHEVTFSPAWKSELSYNAPSNTLAYASVQAASTTKNASSTTQSTVSVINTLTNTGKDIGPGSDPVVLPGGQFILVRNQNALSVINSGTGKDTQLLSIASSAPFAVSPDGHTVSLYNNLAKTVDTFDISQIISASYVSSKPVTGIVIGLTYAEGKVLVATVPQSKSTAVSIGYLGETKPISSFTAPFGSIPQELNFIYE